MKKRCNARVVYACTNESVNRKELGRRKNPNSAAVTMRSFCVDGNGDRDGDGRVELVEAVEAVVESGGRTHARKDTQERQEAYNNGAAPRVLFGQPVILTRQKVEIVERQQ
jgi:hypothetical protein